MPVKRDPYCWDCHRNGSEVFCPKCSIGFHLDCAERYGEKVCASNPFSTERTLARICQQCQRIQKLCNSMKRYKKIDKKRLNLILKAILTSGQGGQPVPEIMWSKFGDGRFRESYFIHFFNFSVIEDKLNNEEYFCTEELLFDLRKTNHVMKIGHERDKTKQIDEYIERVQELCREVELCPHCVDNYLVQLRGPVEPCPWGHRLVIIDQSQGFNSSLSETSLDKLKKFPPIFPAKFLLYNQSTKIVTIRPFGPLMSLEVPRDNVLHLRAADLDELRTYVDTLKVENGRRELENALDMLNIHIEKLRKMFGESIFLTEEKRYWGNSDKFFIFRGLGRPKIQENQRSKPESPSTSNYSGAVTRTRSKLKKSETNRNQKPIASTSRERARSSASRCEVYSLDSDEDSDSSGIGSMMNGSITSTTGTSQSDRHQTLPELSANFVDNILNELETIPPRNSTPCFFANCSNLKSESLRVGQSSSASVLPDVVLENISDFPTTVSHFIEIETDSNFIDLTLSEEETDQSGTTFKIPNSNADLLSNRGKRLPELINQEKRANQIELILRNRNMSHSNCSTFENREQNGNFHERKTLLPGEETKKVTNPGSQVMGTDYSRLLIKERLDTLKTKHEVLSEQHDLILSEYESERRKRDEAASNTSAVHSCEPLERKVQQMRMILEDMKQTEESLVEICSELNNEKVKVEQGTRK